MKRLAVLLTIALAAPAFAQQPQVTAEQAVAYLDKDGDKKVSLQEYGLFQVPRFGQFDANGNAVLDVKEFEASLQGEGKKNAARSFTVFNAGENPAGLTQREFLGYHAYVFNNFVDTNKDGFMTAAEWAKVVGQS